MEKLLEKAAEFLKKNDDFLVICHYDADGLTSGAIMGLTLKRLGKKFEIMASKALDDERIKKIKEKGKKNLIFVDLGSSTLEKIEDQLKEFNVLISDHHKPDKEKTFFLNVNPHYYGIDGAREISGAGVTYLIAKKVNEKNIDLAKIAIIGAVGDMQDKEGKLIGENRKILKDAVKSGELIVKKDLRLYGRYSRPLTQFLAYSTDPFLPGLVGEEEECARFITSLGIPLKKDDKWRCYADLSEDEKKRFASAIYIYAKQHGLPEFVLKGMVGEVYELVKEKEPILKDAKEFATLLNACGRHDKEEIGIKVAMGDRKEKFKEAAKMLAEHRRMLKEGIDLVKNNGIRETQWLYVVEFGDKVKDTIIGTIAGMLYSALIVGNDKPVIALAIDPEGMIKISGRGTLDLVRQGLDLGKAMKKAASEVGGAGGGHDVAAGARINPDKKEEFLKILDEEIKKQLSS